MLECTVPASSAVEFAEVISSPLTLADVFLPSSLADLIFRRTPDEDDTQPIILGTNNHHPLTVSLRSYRYVTVRVSERLKALGLSAGDCVCLARLPRSSETLASILYGALAASGMRVLFPMYLDAESFGEWLLTAKAKAVVWAASELLQDESHEADRALLQRLETTARQMDIPTYCFEKDFGVSALLEQPTESYDTSSAAVQALCNASTADDVTLFLTTSGTSGRAKLVCYRQRAILNCCASWSAAGFFSPDKLGGRCLCLLLAHSMGLRSFWNAMWTRQPLCLIPPEWFLEHPNRVRALLVEMKPQHLTGGPAAFHTILELSRIFPQLKDSCFQHLRHVVSNGAPFDPILAHQIRSALGLQLENAFGMTETMQAVCTLAEGPLGRRSGLMGNPLPGVEIGLEATLPNGEGVFKLWLRSPFGFDRYLAGDGDNNSLDEIGWFHTGDLVERNPEGLRYVGREETDFVKDGFGVKVPLALLRERYRDLDASVRHVELFPLVEEPGLAAIIFVDGPTGDGTNESSTADSPWLKNRRICQRVRGKIEARHEKLLAVLDDFELRHLTIARFACVAEPQPMTPKGNVSRQQIESRYREACKGLTGRLVRTEGIVRIKRERLLQPATTRLTSPRRGELMRLAHLDKNYVRAEGDYLYYEQWGELKRVLDLVGGFGMNLFGHRHPALIAAATQFAQGHHPWIADQGSLRRHEGELATVLVSAVGDITGQAYIVRFGSTGAEAVEMALAHAFLERQERWSKWKRSQQRRFGHRAPQRLAQILAAAERIMAEAPPKVVVIEGSFHGYSLGARSLLGGGKNRLFSPMSRLTRVELPRRDDVDVDSLLAAHDLILPSLAEEQGVILDSEERFSAIIAAIYEPIQGEGGIYETPNHLVRQLERREFPLIADEIQCGLGRTGSFLASAGIHANYYLFAKALGGGIAKISALLMEQPRYVARFDEHYSTTFGGDAFSCAIACRVLALIQQEDVPARAAARGAVLKAQLTRLAAEHPQAIRSITGRGLMLGINFEPAAGDRMLSLRLAERHELLGLAVAAYLLNRHQLRLLPTLSAHNTLRVEPSVNISDDDIQQLEDGLRAFCQAVESCDSAELLGCLVEEELCLPDAADEERELPTFSCALEEPAANARRVAFLGHFVVPEREIAMLDPALGKLPRAARGALIEQLMGLTEMKPTPLMARNLFNGRIWFSFILIGADAAQIEERRRSGRRNELISRIQEGVELAARQGCEIVSLGAYTSAVTSDGMAIHAPSELRVTTGNSLTVAVGVRRILLACRNRGIVPGCRATLAVIGATGNIGAALTRRLLDHDHPFSQVILVARDLRRLQTLADALVARHPEISVKVSKDLAALRGADVMVVAAGTNEPLLYPHHIESGRPTVVADISVPAAISPMVQRLENVHIIPLAGTLALPGEADFVMASHIDSGTAFCCAAEAMLLGLAPASLLESLSLLGPVEPKTVDALARLADDHGFLLDLGDSGLLRGLPE
jgi:acetylornithine/succinyldiaminopimelate/putrescine aminotransferase/predicted amino acid dehydrogenase/long-subunit acyl-CoA synthetase (AMP-forming)